MPTKRNYPEHAAQSALFTWAGYAKGRYPDLALMFAVPNAARRTKGQRGWLLDEGLKAGVPDICLPAPRYDDNGRVMYHGMFIEMKAGKGRSSAAQSAWLDSLEKKGYYTIIANGFEEAKEAIEWYLTRNNKAA